MFTLEFFSPLVDSGEKNSNLDVKADLNLTNFYTNLQWDFTKAYMCRMKITPLVVYFLVTFFLIKMVSNHLGFFSLFFFSGGGKIWRKR